MIFNTLDNIMTKVAVCEHGLQCIECCWLWQGGIDTSGYGKVKYHGHRWSAPKIIFILHSKIPMLKSFYACHTCDVSLCCSWHHIYEGDAMTNARDRAESSRAPRGTQQVQHKLTESDVVLMRKMYDSIDNDGRRIYSIAELADEFNIGKSVAQRIIRRIDWSHVA